MLALTLHRPWPWAIFNLAPEAAKRVENRSWKPPARVIGTRIAIHAGGQHDFGGGPVIQKAARDYLPFGQDGRRVVPYPTAMGMIGTVRIAGVVDAFGAVVMGTVPRDLVVPPLTGSGTALCSRRVWAWFAGPFGWLLDDVRALPEPIPCRGFQKLWKVPDDIAARLS